MTTRRGANARTLKLDIIEQVTLPLLVPGEVVHLTTIATDYALTGALAALADVEALYPRLLWRLRNNHHIPVVPVADGIMTFVNNGTKPVTDAELSACVAGIGYASKTIAIYRPLDAQEDLLFIRHIIQRMQSKPAEPVKMDVENQHLPDPGRIRVNDRIDDVDDTRRLRLRPPKSGKAAKRLTPKP